MADERLDALIVGATPAALRCEARAKALGLLVKRLDALPSALPPARFRVDASEDASLAMRLCVFTRNDFELKSETGERDAPEEPVAATTPRRVTGDLIVSANDLDDRVPFPDATSAGGLPLRALYSCWNGSLFMAGTAISLTAQAQRRLMTAPEVLARTGDAVACAIATARRHNSGYHRDVYGNHFDEFRRLDDVWVMGWHSARA